MTEPASLPATPVESELAAPGPELVEPETVLNLPVEVADETVRI